MSAFLRNDRRTPLFMWALGSGLVGFGLYLLVEKVPPELFSEGAKTSETVKHDSTVSHSGVGAGPVAERRSHPVVAPHGTRDDPYYWLRDDTRKDSQVLAYLEAENKYTERVLAPVSKLQEKLYAELVGRIAPAEQSPPYRKRGYLYWTEHVEGGEFPVYKRRRDTSDSTTENVLDVNVLAKGHAFYQVGSLQLRDDDKVVAFAEDTVGRRKYVIRFKELGSGTIWDEQITGTTGSMAWSADGRHLFYVEQDPVTLLGIRVKRHAVGTALSEDVVVYEESERSFYMSLARTGDNAYVLIHLSSTVSDEVHYLDAHQPLGKFEPFLERERDHEYSVDHIAGTWVLHSNWEAKNFRLFKVPDGKVSKDRAAWQELVPHRGDTLLSSYQAFRGHLVTQERSGGTQTLVVRDWEGKELRPLPADEEVYVARLGTNAEQDAVWPRYQYSSLVTPKSTYEVNMDTGESRLLKRQTVLGGFDSARYVTERQWATARDGTKVPVSLLYRKGTAIDGSAPLYQYGYGSYGASMDPDFRSNTLSLVERGFVFAIAHVRGGQEMGRAWYEDGRQLQKKNSFTDFIDVTKFLVAERYADPSKVVIAGGSAGGLLVGAVANMEPDLYRAVIAHVPFVDVVTTMLDEGLPLTTNEFDEWGNPKQKPFYDYMLSYSPYDNVVARPYPAMFVTTGLWDSQVQYFEPAKWVARLRAQGCDARYPILMHTNLEAGHGGASGRFRRLKLVAQEYAFILQEFGLAKGNKDLG